MKKTVYESEVFAYESKEIFPFKVSVEEETNKEKKTIKVVKSEYRALFDMVQEKKLIILECSWNDGN